MSKSKAKMVEVDPATVKKLKAKKAAEAKAKAEKVETKPKKAKGNSKAINLSSKKNVKTGTVSVRQLLEGSAEYNPRRISESRLQGLGNSMTTYGDMSGIVFNVATKTLVSGHQRIKIAAQFKSKVEKKAHDDEHGTVAIGHVVFKDDKGATVRIPYREVNWSQVEAEKAANIAANAHGGEFDTAKLAKLVAELDVDTSFGIETLGIDALTLKQLNFKDLDTPSTNRKGSDDDEEEGFKEYDGKSFNLKHTCPKCKFKFDA